MGGISLFYYVDCPFCKKDLSFFATEENLAAQAVYCPFCQEKLRLRFAESWEEELGCVCGMYWFEKI